MHIKKGDTVAIIAGKDKGKDGKVLVAMPKDHKVVVEGINIQKRHTKPKSAQQTGGILEKAGAVDVSNVMVICPKCKKATKVAMAFDDKGNKYRACKKEGCGENLDKRLEKAEKTDKKAVVKKTAEKKAPAKKESDAVEVKTEKKTTAKKESDAVEVKTEKKTTAKKTVKADKAE